LTTRSILELLRQINRSMGITIVVITHQMNVIREICSHVAVIDNAKIVESGTMEQVLSNPYTGIAQELFSSFGYEGNPAVPFRCYRVTPGGGTGTDSVIAGLVQACGVPVQVIPENENGGFDQNRLLLRVPDDKNAAFRIREYLNAQNIFFEEVSGIVEP
jgi:D-methionine transport system ATP-binding protein